MTLVIARDFRQYETFVCDMVDEGMDRKEFIFVSHVEMLRNYFKTCQVVKLPDCYANKAPHAVDSFENELFRREARVYTKWGFTLEQRVKRALKNKC